MLDLAGLNCCFLLGQVFFILLCSIFSVESPALALLDLRGRVFNTSSWSYRAIKLLLLSHSLLLHLHMHYSPPHRLQDEHIMLHLGWYQYHRSPSSWTSCRTNSFNTCHKMLLNTCPSSLTGSWLPKYLNWVLIAPSQPHWYLDWVLM